jgi:hypothetical protein
MHKGVILLVKATDRDEATKKVRTFMEPYGDGKVWDWYVIGGRWSNILIPADKAKAYNEYADNVLEDLEGHPGFITDVEVKKKRPLLQAKWAELGLAGNCSHTDNYSLSDDGDAYDVVVLSDCLEKVKSWVKDVPAEIEEVWVKLVEAKTDKSSMVGYYAKELYNLDYGNFCFDSNVYDITEEEAESIPDDPTGYFAVMVDIHN